MNISKPLKNTALASLVALWTFGGLIKTSDYFSKEISENFKTHYTRSDIEDLHYTMPPNLLSHQSSQPLSHQTKKNDMRRAMREYIQHSLPQSNYATDSDFFTRLVENRIEDKLFPGSTFPTGIEEFNINIRKEHGDALCASAIWAKLRMLNMRSEHMRQFFAKQGKHTRFAQQLLSQHGRKSTTNTIDNTQYYDHTTRNVLHPHYHNILKNLHNSSSGNIITSRYASSGSLSSARRENKNATHSILSLGTITQNFTWSEIWIEKWSQIYKDFINSNLAEQKVIIIYQLLKTRAVKSNMVGEETKQKDRIRMLLQQYPDLLSLTPTIEKENIIIVLRGVMGEHVYPIAGDPTNYVHYLFEIIAYNGGMLNNDGSVFLLCDEMTPTEYATKDHSYNKLSPLYEKINWIRNTIIHPDMILSTYIVSFDDIDINRNRKIDYWDKTIAEVLNEMSEVCYKSSYLITQIDKQTTKEYLKKYLHILWAIDRFPTWTILPIPYLTEENRDLIDNTYQLYITSHNELERTSQKKYSDYILKKIEKKSLSDWVWKQLIVYPVCAGDDPISITQQIGKYIDKIREHNVHNPEEKTIKFSNLSREEYNRIFKIIQKHIIFPNSYPKQALRANQKVYIDLAKCIASIDKEYYQTKALLSSNLVPEVKELQQFDNLYDILDINESTRNIQKHIIIRETWWSMSVFDIAKARSRAKMSMEYLNFDNNNLLKNIVKINSEWPLQIRLEYYLSAKNDIELIVQSSQKLLEKSSELWLRDNQQEKLKEIIELSTELQYSIIMMENKNITTSPEFQEKRWKLKYILSDIIDLTWKSLKNPEKDLWSLLSIQISAYTIERYLWRYQDKFQEAIGKRQISQEEFSFIQQFTVIAHHLGQKDADSAFKVYMSIHLMWIAKQWGIISIEQNAVFQESCKALNSIKKPQSGWLVKKYNNQRYADRYHIINKELGQEENKYIQDILNYLSPQNNAGGIPHYEEISKEKQNISLDIFDASATKEFSLYLTTVPPESDLISILLLSLFTIVWWVGLYTVNKR